MLARSIPRRPLLAVAGVTAGVASVAVAPAAANAQDTALEPEAVRAVPVNESAPTEPNPASHGTCQGATRFFLPSRGSYVWLPTLTQNSGNTHCTLMRGNTGTGVLKLQDALDKCDQGDYSITPNGVFDAQTADALMRTQVFWGIPVDGRYDPTTRSTMLWPEYDANNQFLGTCVRLPIQF